MQEQTRLESGARRPASRDPGPLDLTAPTPERPAAEPLNAVEMLGYLGATVFAETPLKAPQSLSEICAAAWRHPHVRFRHVLHDMVEAPGVDTGAARFDPTGYKK